MECIKEDITVLAENLRSKANEILQLMMFNTDAMNSSGFVGNATEGRTGDVQELLKKERLSDRDRAVIRSAIMAGKINEQDIRCMGAR